MSHEVACDPITEDCADRKCDSCPSLDSSPIEIEETINFYEGKKNENCSYPTKEVIELTEIYLKIEKSLNQIVRHYYNKRQRSKTYQQKLEYLKVEEALIHVDYSENYKN